MALLIARDFASTAGVSPAAVSKALKKGRLVAVDGHLDTDNPLNWRFIVEHAGEVTSKAAAILSSVEPELEDGMPGEEDSSLEVFADFGAGFKPVVRYSFDASDLERDTILYPIPRPVRVNFDDDDPAVFDAETGTEYPATLEVIERGAILARRVRA